MLDELAERLRERPVHLYYGVRRATTSHRCKRITAATGSSFPASLRPGAPQQADAIGISRHGYLRNRRLLRDRSFQASTSAIGRGGPPVAAKPPGASCGCAWKFYWHDWKRSAKVCQPAAGHADDDVASSGEGKGSPRPVRSMLPALSGCCRVLLDDRLARSSSLCRIARILRDGASVPPGIPLVDASAGGGL